MIYFLDRDRSRFRVEFADLGIFSRVLLLVEGGGGVDDGRILPPFCNLLSVTIWVLKSLTNFFTFSI